MKRFLFLLSFLVFNLIHAEYSISGNIANYNNQDLFIFTYINNVEILANKTSTDAKGNFTYKSKSDYSGIVKILLANQNAFKIFFVDNNPINFKAKLGTKDLEILQVEDGANQMYYQYINLKINKSKIEALNQLKLLYNPTDSFYSIIDKELSEISKNSELNFSQYPFIQYYITLETSILQKEVYTLEEVDQVSKLIENHLINDGEELEKTNLMNNIISLYLTYKLTTYDTSEAQIAHIRPVIDHLLDETVIETTRGQNVLVTIINLLKGFGLDYIANEYVEKANELTCTKTTQLQNTLSVNQNTKVGSTFENFKFSHPIQGYSSLYDIKSKYKLVIFWGSFCPHCQSEKPVLQAYYDEFKSKGGEIISYSIEKNKEEYSKFINGVNWIADTDYLFWSSPVVNQYGIDGTPTFFLLDKDNKILAKASKLEIIKPSIL